MYSKWFIIINIKILKHLKEIYLGQYHNRAIRIQQLCGFLIQIYVNWPSKRLFFISSCLCNSWFHLTFESHLSLDGLYRLEFTVDVTLRTALILYFMLSLAFMLPKINEQRFPWSRFLFSVVVWPSVVMV